VRAKIALDTLWITFWMAFVLFGINAVPFHGDESTLIYNTTDYVDQFIDRDLSVFIYGNPAVDPMDQNLRLLDGRVHKYLAGLFWHVRGFTPDDLNTPWDWGADWTYNLNAGHLPTPELLITARAASAVLAALGVAAIFGIGLTLQGRIAAYAMSLFYALHPAILLNGRRSMMEGALLLFGLLTVLAALHLLRRRSALWAGVLGLAAGFALASKQSALVPVALVFIGVGVALLIERRRLLPDLIRWSAAGVIAIAVFVVMNPIWWSDPIGVARAVFAERTRLLSGQVDYFGGYPDLGAKLDGFVRYSLIGTPQYYEVEVWRDWIGEAIAGYDASIWRGVSFGESTLGLIALGIVLIIGMISLFRHDPNRILIAIWAVISIAITIAITPLPWQRYYLPILPAIAVIFGLGIAAIVNLVIRYRRGSVS
jgi:4-amino-4-deoxy-L-arabinose transferase-like glycosyltransferase